MSDPNRHVERCGAVNDAGVRCRRTKLTADSDYRCWQHAIHEIVEPEPPSEEPDTPVEEPGTRSEHPGGNVNRIVALARREPVRVQEIVSSAMGLAIAFGMDVSGEQQAAVLALVAVIVGGGEIARRRVTPVDREGAPSA